MFYIHPTEKWIKNVVQTINEKQLNIEKSKFMIAFFSSMDNQFVDYFKKNKEQISSFSGKNFHIFTPFIVDGKLVPDDEWRSMRHEFNALGIPVNTNPTFIFFSLKRNSEGEYEPYFFAGYTCPTFKAFPEKLKNAIDISTLTADTEILERKLFEIFLSRNIISSTSVNLDFKHTVMNVLPKNKIFVSHSSADKPFVRKLISELSDLTGSNFWFDENEIQVGDNIQSSLTDNLKTSDYLLLVISEKSTISSWVNFEVSQFMGLENGKNIIPILLSKEYPFPEPLDNTIRTLKYLDFSDSGKWTNNINELKRKLSMRN